ncbi:MAG: OadG family protein [Tannerella sp.]|nr:OadG family protein [Tannerella sp.]
MENIGLGFLLMWVGMITVFLILLILIGLGKLLILWVNRYAPAQPRLLAEALPAVSRPSGGIPKEVVAAIVSSVSVTTGGKGRVTSVRKQQNACKSITIND